MIFLREQNPLLILKEFYDKTQNLINKYCLTENYLCTFCFYNKRNLFWYKIRLLLRQYLLYGWLFDRFYKNTRYKTVNNLKNAAILTCFTMFDSLLMHLLLF